MLNKYRVLFMSATTVLSVIVGGLGWHSAAGQVQGASELVFTVPLGTDQGIHYQGVGMQEALTWGPADMTAAPDGTFWLADTVSDRILHYDRSGKFLQGIDLLGDAVGATDLEVQGDTVIVLDQASMPPKVLAIGNNGKVQWIQEVPDEMGLDSGLSGIALGDNGELLLELVGGDQVAQLLDSAGKVSPQSPKRSYLNNGKEYSAHASGLDSPSPNSGTVTIGAVHVDVKVENNLGGLYLLGFDGSGGVFVVSEEVLLDGSIRVDQTITHYSGTDKVEGVARVPIADQYTYVGNGLTVGQDGFVYFLATRPDRAEVRRLTFVSHLDRILVKQPSGEAGGGSSVVSSEGVTACVSRSAMTTNAAAYYNNQKYLSSTNINGTCSGRGKPRYLGAAGTYRAFHMIGVAETR